MITGDSYIGSKRQHRLSDQVSANTSDLREAILAGTDLREAHLGGTNLSTPAEYQKGLDRLLRDLKAGGAK